MEVLFHGSVYAASRLKRDAGKLQVRNRIAWSTSRAPQRSASTISRTRWSDCALQIWRRWLLAWKSARHWRNPQRPRTTATRFLPSTGRWLRGARPVGPSAHTRRLGVVTSCVVVREVDLIWCKARSPKGPLSTLSSRSVLPKNQA